MQRWERIKPPTNAELILASISNTREHRVLNAGIVSITTETVHTDGLTSRKLDNATIARLKRGK